MGTLCIFCICYIHALQKTKIRGVKYLLVIPKILQAPIGRSLITQYNYVLYNNKSRGLMLHFPGRPRSYNKRQKTFLDFTVKHYTTPSSLIGKFFLKKITERNYKENHDSLYEEASEKMLQHNFGESAARQYVIPKEESTLFRSMTAGESRVSFHLNLSFSYCCFSAQENCVPL